MLEEINAGTYNPKQGEYPFNYQFSPSITKMIKRAANLENPFTEVSRENIQAHLDVLKTLSPAKLYVGSYEGKLKLMDANKVSVTITNRTTANSLFLHAGDYLKEKGVMNVQQFNYLFSPLLTPTQQTYQFTVPLNR